MKVSMLPLRDEEVVLALQRAGLRGLTVGDIVAGLKQTKTEVRAACARLIADGQIEEHGAAITLPAREWARLINARRVRGAARSFEADVAQMLAGQGEKV